MAGGSFQYSQHRRKPTSSTLTAENVTVLFLVLSCTLKCNLVGCKTKGRGSWLRTSKAQLKASQGASSVSVTMWPQSSWWPSTSSPENSWRVTEQVQVRHSWGSGTQEAGTPSVNYLHITGTVWNPIANRSLLWVRLTMHESTGSRKQSEEGQQMLAIHIWLVPAIRKSFKRPAGFTSSCCKKGPQPYFSPSNGGQTSAVGWQVVRSAGIMQWDLSW